MAENLNMAYTAGGVYAHLWPEAAEKHPAEQCVSSASELIRALWDACGACTIRMEADIYLNASVGNLHADNVLVEMDGHRLTIGAGGSVFKLHRELHFRGGEVVIFNRDCAGIMAGGDIVFTQCKVTIANSGGVGVETSAGAVLFRDCNVAIINTGGAGVEADVGAYLSGSLLVGSETPGSRVDLANITHYMLIVEGELDSAQKKAFPVPEDNRRFCCLPEGVYAVPKWRLNKAIYT